MTHQPVTHVGGVSFLLLIGVVCLSWHRKEEEWPAGRMKCNSFQRLNFAVKLHVARPLCPLGASPWNDRVCILSNDSRTDRE